MESLFVQHQISTVCQENGSKASLPCLLPFSEVLAWISAVLSLPAVLKVEHTGLHLGWLPSFWWRFPWFWPELQSGQHTGIANVKTKAILPTFAPSSLPPSQCSVANEAATTSTKRKSPTGELHTPRTYSHMPNTSCSGYQTEIKFSDNLPSLPHTHLFNRWAGTLHGCFITHQTTTSSISGKEENSLFYFILVVLVGSDSVTHTKAFYSNNEWQVWWL